MALPADTRYLLVEIGWQGDVNVVDVTGEDWWQAQLFCGRCELWLGIERPLDTADREVGDTPVAVAHGVIPPVRVDAVLRVRHDDGH